MVSNILKSHFNSSLFLIVLFAINVNSQTYIEEKTKKLFSNLENAGKDEKLPAYIELLDYLVITAPNKAVETAVEAISLFEGEQYLSGIAEMNLRAAAAYQKLHQPMTAMEYIKNAYRLMNLLGDSSNICRAKIQFGVLKIITGEIGEAIDFMYRAESLALRIGDSQRHIDALNYLGIINYILDNNDNAVVYSDSALKLSKQLNYKNGEALAYEHLGIININRRNYDRALEFNTKAYEIRKELDDLTVISEIYDNYSIIYTRMNDIDKAIYYTEKSMKLREQYGDVNGMGSNFMGLGSIYKSQNKQDLALDYYKRAYQIKKEANDLRAFTVILRNLSELYEQKNDFENAFKYLREFRTYNDSLFGENTRRMLLRAEAKHQLAQQKAEIESLRKINNIQERLQNFFIIIAILSTLLAMAIIIMYLINRGSNKKLSEINKKVLEQRNSLQQLNRELISLNKDREKFFSIIAHDLRSPFSPMLSYSDLLMTDIDKLDKNEISLYAKNIYLSGKRVYNLLDNLLQWLGINSGKMKVRPAQFDIKNEIPQIFELFNESASQKGVKLINKINTETFVYADKEMIGSVIRNLISNAIKYSNIGGSVSVSAKPINGLVECTISDTGIGMDDETLSKLFTIETKSIHGTNNEVGSGLGLLLCKELVEKNGGTISVESKMNVGTSFTFTIPADKYPVRNS